MSSASNHFGSRHLVLTRHGYDQLGRRTSLTRGKGTVTGYGYDPVSRLASLTQNLPGTSHDLTLGFTYNPASQIRQHPVERPVQLYRPRQRQRRRHP